MGRELKRKEAKRNNKSVIEEKKEVNPKEEIYKIVKILSIILVILVVVYLLVGIFLTKEISFKNNKKESGVISNSKNILVSEVFRQTEEKYYVYFSDFENTINSVESAMTSKLYNYSIYRVDMGSGFNSKYASEIGNANAQKVEEFKIVVPTLIMVENDTIVKYVEGEDAILNYING